MSKADQQRILLNLVIERQEANEKAEALNSSDYDYWQLKGLAQRLDVLIDMAEKGEYGECTVCRRQVEPEQLEYAKNVSPERAKVCIRCWIMKKKPSTQDEWSRLPDIG